MDYKSKGFINFMAKCEKIKFLIFISIYHQNKKKKKESIYIKLQN